MEEYLNLIIENLKGVISDVFVRRVCLFFSRVFGVFRRCCLSFILRLRENY